MAAPAPPAADELPGPAARRPYSRMEASCLELALEGERLCKAGDFRAGVAFFEAAVQVGTEDLKTLSAIYSQLGNAYFYLREFARALEYHKHDLLLARTIGDRMGEAKASGNLGNTLKVLGRFDEAIVCCQRHLAIAQEQGDKVGEARALYNMGNVYHAKGKQLSWNAAQDPGHLPPAVRETLRRASEFYERNLSLVKELGDRAAQGRAYGNLGNTQYLLGNFAEATAFHKERLAIAKEFGDKAAERRAYSNLGNAHIFLGRFDVAAEYYKKTLQLSRQLRDQAVEAQACYSLGNTYTLLQDYERAAEYHLRHLLIAQELADRVGEGRACWSLGNAYVSMGSPAQALTFAKKHLQISQEIGDRNGELTARMNVAQLQLALGRLGSPAAAEKPDLAGYEAQGARPKRTQRLSAETWDLLRLPPEREQNGDSHHAGDWRGPGRDSLPLPVRSRKYQEGPREGSHSPLDSADVRVQVPRTCLPRAPSADDECLFDLLSKFQGSRMDDQRCPLQEAAAGPEQRGAQPAMTASPQTEEFFDLIASSQSRRLDDQRASVGSLPGLRVTHNNVGHLRADGDTQEPGDEFFSMLIKCQRTGNHRRGRGVRTATSNTAPPERPRVPAHLHARAGSRSRAPRPPTRTRRGLCRLPSLLLRALRRTRGPWLDAEVSGSEEQALELPSGRLQAPRASWRPLGGREPRTWGDSHQETVPKSGLAAGFPGGRGRPAVARPVPREPALPLTAGPRGVSTQSSRIDDQRCPPPDVLPRGPTMPDEDFFSLIQRVQAKRMDEQRVDLAGSPEQEAGGPPEPRPQCQPGTG